MPAPHMSTRRSAIRTRLTALLTLASILFASSLAFPAVATAQVDDAHTVSADGIGSAIVGSSLAEMQNQLGAGFDFVDVGPIVVDVDGFEVRQGAMLQFYAGQVAGDSGLNFMLVDNPDYQTAEGVGPGTTIADAVAIYGVPTITYNNDNEGREFVSFANGPSGRISFRTDDTTGRVGIYPNPDASFGETSDYIDGAVIASIWISCVPGRDCPVYRLPDTGVNDTSALLVVIGAALIASGTLLLAGSHGTRRFQITL